jgi:hypothetical protein
MWTWILHRDFKFYALVKKYPRDDDKCNTFEITFMVMVILIFDTKNELN